MNVNYSLVLENLIKEITQKEITPRVLLHSCCGPCSSYVLEYLTKYFSVTVFYYNPCIYPTEEYIKRKGEQIKLINSLPTHNKVDILDADYSYNHYLEYVKGFEKEREGGGRCALCFEMRLMETCKMAKENNYDYFATTLTVSPHKNSRLINKIGGEIQDKTGVKYLFSDFKKKEGYKRSIVLSKEYDLYRQNYCGCEFSLKESMEYINNHKNDK